MEHYRACRIHRSPRGIETRIENLCISPPAPGQVIIEASYSSINYKDALAATGAGRILRSFPLVGGTDVSGVVAVSEHCDFRPRNLDSIVTRKVDLEDLPTAFSACLDSQVIGRTLVVIP